MKKFEPPKINRQKEFTGTRSVRKGFELDTDALQAYMEKNVEGFSGTIDAKQFKGGQSNPTYQISAGGKKYVLRRKPMGKLLKSAHAVDREYKVTTALARTDVPVARTYALCQDDAVIGSWFYIMENVEGRIYWTIPDTPIKERKDIFYAMNDTFAKLHNVDYKAIGLEDFGKAGNFFNRQISIWTQQYRNSVDEKYPAMEKLIEWLEDNIPENDDVSIVHGDYRLDNLVFHPTEPKVIAILDWELSTLGHPLADFAYHCLPWYYPGGQDSRGLKGLDPVALNFPTEEEYITRYFKQTGHTTVENWNYYIAFSLFRSAGIAFGIMGRVKDGTAVSEQAKMSGAFAKPLAELGYEQTQK